MWAEPVYNFLIAKPQYSLFLLLPQSVCVWVRERKKEKGEKKEVGGTPVLSLALCFSDGLGSSIYGASLHTNAWLQSRAASPLSLKSSFSISDKRWNIKAAQVFQCRLSLLSQDGVYDRKPHSRTNYTNICLLSTFAQKFFFPPSLVYVKCKHLCFVSLFLIVCLFVVTDTKKHWFVVTRQIAQTEKRKKMIKHCFLI